MQAVPSRANVHSSELAAGLVPRLTLTGGWLPRSEPGSRAHCSRRRRVAACWLVARVRLRAPAVTVEVLASAGLLALSSLRLLAWSASRGVPVLVMGIGLLLIIAPVVFRYGYLDRVVAAYVNDIAEGLVVLTAGFWLSRQGPHERGPAAPGR